MNVPISPAVKVGNTVYFGGIAPINEDGIIVDKNDVVGQTKRIIHRLEEYLAKVNMKLENLVFMTVYLSDIKLYDKMNEVYAEMMPQPFPARKVVETPLTLEGMVVEITGIACIKGKEVL